MAAVEAAAAASSLTQADVSDKALPAAFVPLILLTLLPKIGNVKPFQIASLSVWRSNWASPSLVRPRQASPGLVRPRQAQGPKSLSHA